MGEGDSSGVWYGVIDLLIGFVVINLNIHVGVSWENEQPNVTSKRQALNSSMPISREIDIIFREGDVQVFIEVKTRSSATGIRPASAVNPKKAENFCHCSRLPPSAG